MSARRFAVTFAIGVLFLQIVGAQAAPTEASPEEILTRYTIRDIANDPRFGPVRQIIDGAVGGLQGLGEMNPGIKVLQMRDSFKNVAPHVGFWIGIYDFYNSASNENATPADVVTATGSATVSTLSLVNVTTEGFSLAGIGGGEAVALYVSPAIAAVAIGAAITTYQSFKAVAAADQAVKVEIASDFFLGVGKTWRESRGFGLESTDEDVRASVDGFLERFIDQGDRNYVSGFAENWVELLKTRYGAIEDPEDEILKIKWRRARMEPPFTMNLRTWAFTYLRDELRAYKAFVAQTRIRQAGMGQRQALEKMARLAKALRANPALAKDFEDAVLKAVRETEPKDRLAPTEPTSAPKVFVFKVDVFDAVTGAPIPISNEEWEDVTWRAWVVFRNDLDGEYTGSNAVFKPRNNTLPPRIVANDWSATPAERQQNPVMIGLAPAAWDVGSVGIPMSLTPGDPLAGGLVSWRGTLKVSAAGYRPIGVGSFDAGRHGGVLEIPVRMAHWSPYVPVSAAAPSISAFVQGFGAAGDRPNASGGWYADGRYVGGSGGPPVDVLEALTELHGSYEIEATAKVTSGEALNASMMIAQFTVDFKLKNRSTGGRREFSTRPVTVLLQREVTNEKGGGRTGPFLIVSNPVGADMKYNGMSDAALSSSDFLGVIRANLIGEAEGGSVEEIGGVPLARSIMPLVGEPGQTVAIRVVGEGFVAGGRAEFGGGEGVIVKSVSAPSASEQGRRTVTVTVAISANAVPGPRAGRLVFPKGTIDIPFTVLPKENVRAFLDAGRDAMEIRQAEARRRMENEAARASSRFVNPVTRDGAGPITAFNPEEFGSHVRTSMDAILVAYQREDVSGVLDIVSRDFRGLSSQSTNIDYSTLALSLQSDYQAFENKSINASAQSFRVFPEARQAEVVLLWDNRERLQASGLEIIQKERRTRFVFVDENGAAKLLYQDLQNVTNGEILLGRSNPATGVATITADAGSQSSTGTLTTATTVTVASPSSGGTTAGTVTMTADTTTTETTTTVTGGTLTSNTTITSNQTLTSDLVIPAGITLTVNSGVMITIGAGFRIQVFGTLNATSATFTSGGTWAGILFEAGSAGTLSSVTVQNATVAIKASGGTITLSTFTATSNVGGIEVAGGTVSASNVTIQNNSGGGVTVTSGSLTINGGTISTNTMHQVRAAGGSLTLQGGLAITSTVGSGITILGGATVTGNSGSVAIGSTTANGITFIGAGTLTMTGGSVNQATAMGVSGALATTITLTNVNITNSGGLGVNGNTGATTMTSCFLAGNNAAGAGVVDMSTLTPNSGMAPQQYNGLTTVTTPRATAN